MTGRGVTGPEATGPGAAAGPAAMAGPGAAAGPGVAAGVEEAGGVASGRPQALQKDEVLAFSFPQFGQNIWFSPSIRVKNSITDTAGRDRLHRF